MKKYLAFLFAFSASCSPRIIEKSLWQTSRVEVDSRTSEYGEMRLYDSDTKMFYSISNDSTNLYLCLATKDESIQQQIMLAGMDVWIDTAKKSKQLIGIKYPLKASQMPAPPIKSNNDPNQKPDFSKLRQNFILSQKVADIKGFKNIPDGLSPLETKTGFKIKMEWDSNGTLIYEMKIPLVNWYRKISFADSTKIFTLTVNINAIQMPNRNGSSLGGDPADGGFQRPAPGGKGNGYPGGRPPMNNDQMNGMMAMSATYSFRMNFKLNVNAQ